MSKIHNTNLKNSREEKKGQSIIYHFETQSYINKQLKFRKQDSIR